MPNPFDCPAGARGAAGLIVMRTARPCLPPTGRRSRLSAPQPQKTKRLLNILFSEAGTNRLQEVPSRGRRAERRSGGRLAFCARLPIVALPSAVFPGGGSRNCVWRGGETDGRQDGDSARSALCPSLASRFSRPFPAASPTFSPALARPAVLAPPCRPFPARKREPYAALAAEGRHVPHCGNGTASPRSRNVIPALRRGWKACSASRGRVPRRAWRC